MALTKDKQQQGPTEPTTSKAIIFVSPCRSVFVCVSV